MATFFTLGPPKAKVHKIATTKHNSIDFIPIYSYLKKFNLFFILIALSN